MLAEVFYSKLIVDYNKSTAFDSNCDLLLWLLEWSITFISYTLPFVSQKSVLNFIRPLIFTPAFPPRTYHILFYYILCFYLCEVIFCIINKNVWLYLKFYFTTLGVAKTEIPVWPLEQYLLKVIVRDGPEIKFTENNRFNQKIYLW